MELSIRPAGEADAARLAELIEEIERYYGASSIEPLDQRLAHVEQYVFGHNPAASVLLATDARGDVLGMASYSIVWPAAGSTVGLYLKELYVREPYRRRGIGRTLVERVIDLAEEQDCSAVYWTSAADDARAFYDAVGFTADHNSVFYRTGITRQ